MSDPTAMDGAYAKSRGELLQWLNSVLPGQLHASIGEISKVEQCGSGIPFVFLLPRLFPQSPAAVAAPTKVKFPARQEYEASSNLKLVQEVFSKNHVVRHMDIDKMCKRNFQSNLEFLQWFKRLCDSRGLADDTATAATMLPTSSASGGGGAVVSVRSVASPSGGYGSINTGSSPASRKPSTASSVGTQGGAARSLFNGGTTTSSVVRSTSGRLGGGGSALSSGVPASLNGSTSSGGITRASAAVPSGAVGGVGVGRQISPMRRSKSPMGPTYGATTGISGVGPRAVTPTPSSTRRGFTTPPSSATRSHSSGVNHGNSSGVNDPIGYVELERRYYYDKLRRIEELVRQPASDGNELAQVIQKLLYSAH